IARSRAVLPLGVGEYPIIIERLHRASRTEQPRLGLMRNQTRQAERRSQREHQFFPVCHGLTVLAVFFYRHGAESPSRRSAISIPFKHSLVKSLFSQDRFIVNCGVKNPGIDPSYI